MENIMEFIDELNYWLIRHLEPICEADPKVLSKYVIALIQKAPGPGEAKEKSLRQKCLKQLEIFLGNETTSFVDTLFEVIKNRSFSDEPKTKKKGASTPRSSKSAPSEGKSRKATRTVIAPPVKVEAPPESSSGQMDSPTASVSAAAALDVDMRIQDVHNIVDSSNGSNHLEPSELHFASSAAAPSIAELPSIQPADTMVTESMPAAAQVVSSTSLPSAIGSTSGFVGAQYPVATSTSGVVAPSLNPVVGPIKISLNAIPNALSVPDHHFMPSTGSPQPSGNASTAAATSHERGSRNPPNLPSSHSRTSAQRGSTRHPQQQLQNPSTYFQRSSRSHSRESRSSYCSSSSRSSDPDRSRSRSDSRTGSSDSSSISPAREANSGSRSRDRGSKRATGHRSSRNNSPVSGSRRGSRYGSSVVTTSSRGYGKSSYRGQDSGYRSSRTANNYKREHSPSSSRHRHRSAKSSNEASSSSQIPARYQNPSSHCDGHSRRSNQQRTSSRSNQPSSTRGSGRGGDSHRASKPFGNASSSVASSSTLIDYQALAAQYAMTLQASTSAGADTTSGSAGKAASPSETNAPSSSIDEKPSYLPKGNSGQNDATTTSTSSEQASDANAAVVKDVKEKGSCPKGLYNVYNAALATVSQPGAVPSGVQAPSHPAAFYDEPYNPESATIDPSMLLHMLPGFMQLNPLAPQLPPLANRFLGPIASNGAAGGLGLSRPELSLASSSDEQKHSSAGGSFKHDLRMPKLLNQGPIGMLTGGGRPRELLGVSLSGGEPYVPKSVRGPGMGGQKDGNKGRGGNNYYNNNNNSGGHGHYRGGNVQNKRPNVIDIMDRVNPNNNYDGHNSNASRFSHKTLASEIYIPGGADQNNDVSSEGPENAGQFQGNSKSDAPIANDKTWLLIRKIPPKLNNIGSINKHFSRYGTVVNIQVCYENDPESALVQFSNSFEATAAIRSTEAVFNNRFIKVYWAYQNNANNNNNSNSNTNKNHNKGQNGPGGFKQNKPWQNKHHGGQYQQQIQNNARTDNNNDDQFGGRPDSLMTQEKPGVPKFFQRKVLPGPNFHPGVRSQADNSEQEGASGPPIKIISPAERAAKLKELTEQTKSLQEAITNQKHLMGKLELAKTPKEKTAILKLLQLTMKNIKTMQEAVEKIQSDIKPTLRTTKINNKSSTAAAIIPKDEASSTAAANISRGVSLKRRSSSQDTIETEESMDLNPVQEDIAMVNKRARLVAMDSTESVESSTQSADPVAEAHAGATQAETSTSTTEAPMVDSLMEHDDDKTDEE